MPLLQADNSASREAFKAEADSISLPQLPAAPSPIPAPSCEPSGRLLSSRPNLKAQDNMSARPRAAFAANGTSSSNVLYAVIALLEDLDATSLQIVHAEASATQISCHCEILCLLC